MISIALVLFSGSPFFFSSKDRCSRLTTGSPFEKYVRMGETIVIEEWMGAVRRPGTGLTGTGTTSDEGYKVS